MARITVEDCIDKFPSRFELVLVASQRARKLHSGDEPTVANDNDKNTVIALREIADSTLTVDEMKENLIQEFQKVTLSDEEEEILELESIDQKTREIEKSELPLEGNSNLDGYLKHFSNRWKDGVHLPTKYLSKDRIMYWKRKFDDLIKEQGIPFRRFLDPKEVSHRIDQRRERSNSRSELG